MEIIRFDSLTGRPTGILNTIDPIRRCGPGESWVGGRLNDLTQYVNPVTRLKTDRPIMPGTLNKTTITADKMDTAIISNLPPCTVTFAGEAYEVTDGSFELTVDTPGTYEISVEAFPYLPATFTIEAV